MNRPPLAADRPLLARALPFTAALVALAFPMATCAAPITWAAATTIAGDTDVSTAGAAQYAYHWAAGNQTVNGVTFIGTSSATAGGSDVSLSGFTGYYSDFTGTAAPFTNLSAAYRATLAGSPYNAGAAVTVTLRQLAAGRQYQVQVWIEDARIYGQGRTASLASTGGNPVTLDYNSTDTANANGGVGQYSLGQFTADGTTQTFTITGLPGSPNGASTQLNALQVRDVSPASVWINPNGGGWFIGANWESSFVAQGANQIADFSTLTLPDNATVTVDAPVSIGYLRFDDHSPVKHAWTLSGSGPISLQATVGSPVITTDVPLTLAVPLAGAAGLAKSGAGTLTLTSANPYTGATLIDDGSLSLVSPGSAGTGAGAVTLSGSGKLQLQGAPNGNGTEGLSAANYTIGSLASGDAGTMVELAAGGVGNTLTLGGNNATSGFAGTISGASGSIHKAGSGTLTLSGQNTYTGGTTISAGTLRLDVNPIQLPAGLKIMPMGDSITYGASGTHAGYRGYLYSLLAPVAPSFQFIGASTVNPASLPVSPIDQTHHNGYSSYATLHLSNNLDGLDLAPYTTYGGEERDPHGGYWLVGGNGTNRDPAYPDLILLLVGANDINWNTSQINTTLYRANLTTLLNKLTTLRPAARVIVARITPWPGRATDVASVNNAVALVVADFQSRGKQVTSVDLNTGFPADGLSGDGLHPNDVGYLWMANQWRSAISSVVGPTRPVTTALPAATTVTVATGATLDLNHTQASIAGLSVAGKVLLGSGALTTTTSATCAAGSTLATRIHRDDLTAGHLAVTGDLVLDNATLNLSSIGAAILNPGTRFTLATYTGSLAGTFAGLPEGAVTTVGGSPFIVRYSDAGKNITLTVATAFQAWMAGNYPSLTGDDALPGSDPDHDGMTNLAEFAFKGDPTRGSNRGLTAVITTDTNANNTKELTLTIAVRAGAVFSGSPSPSATADGLSYTLRGSQDLVDFAAPVTELKPALTPAQSGLPDIAGSGWEYHTFVLTGSDGLSDRGFIRAEASSP